MRHHSARVCPVVAALLAILGATPLGAASAERHKDGIVLPLADGLLKIEVCAENVVRVAFAKERAFFGRASLVTAPKRCGGGARWDLAAGTASSILKTAQLTVEVDHATGSVSFLDKDGRPILRERPGGRSLVPAEVQGEQTYQPRQVWQANADEALYGLGGHQLGLMNIKGYDLDLWQHNITDIIPFLVSSRGYGILWDNTAYSRFGDLRPFEAIPAARLADLSGQPGALSGSYFGDRDFGRLVATRRDAAIDISIPDRTPMPNQRIHPDLPPQGDVSVRWEGALLPDVTGDHLLRTFSNSSLKVWVDDRLVADHWRQGWLAWYDLIKVHLTAGKSHKLRLEWIKDQGMEDVHLAWKTPAASADTSLWSEVGDGVDYTFVYGPDLDQVIAGYRRVTGQASLMPRWAFGLWQSRERYQTAEQSLKVLEGYRARGIPIDSIVQDWFYWKLDSWGSHEFEAARFPDPEGWIQAIHDQYKARLMISVWGKFNPNTENAKALRAVGGLYERNLNENLKDWMGQPYTFYDAFNPKARRLFWQQVERELFKKGVDAWWMDATEPDLYPDPSLEVQRGYMHPTAMGSGARMLNAYSLVNSQGVYEGQRAAAPDQRVFILTRSAFAGQQRYASATWSGDVTTTWTAFQKQIPAGLSFCLSGIPYWTMDIGGFAVPPRFAGQTMTPENAEEWREMNARWFQYGTFCPLTRVHGQFPLREMWEFGGESHPSYQTQLFFDRLRYRLLPYVYSLAGEATHQDGTMLRALVMDFRGDAQAREVGDQFLFGPALLVSPVTVYKARSRAVYLPPAAGGWYDFWTGAAVAGAQTIDAPAPYERLPLHVRAGSIVPFGPELQYTDEKPADPLTLVVYAGADGAFTLYEDDGLTYGYEKGAFTRIPFRWSDASRTLTIGAREGSFPGVMTQRTFNVVVVSGDKPVPFSFTPVADASARYRGQALEIKLR